MNFPIKKIIRQLLLTIVIAISNKVILAQQTLTLEQCRRLAIDRNNNLKAAEENINAAREIKKQGNTFSKPVVDVTIAGFYFGNPLNTVLPEYGVGPDLSVKQILYSGGRIRLNKESATKGLEIQEEQKQFTTSEVLYQTEVGYWEIVLAGEQIKLAEQNRKQLDSLYTDLDNRYKAGIIYKNDVLHAKVEQYQNELRLTQAHDALTLAKQRLAQITGLAEGTDFVIADSVAGTFNTLENSGDIQTTFTRRSELQILQKSIESEKIAEELLKAALRPSLNLGLDGLAALGKQGINPSNNSNFIASYYGVVNLNFPLFDGGRKRQKIQEQQYRIAAEEYQLKERQEQVSLEVQQAYLQLNQSVKRIELCRLSLVQADENLRLSNDRLKAGTIAGKDVVDAQTIWQQAHSTIIEARIEYRIHEAALRKALGELN